MNVERRTSNVERRTSNVKRRTSNVQRATSHVARRTSRGSSRRYAYGILLVGLVFYLATIRPGHRAGDFAMFMQHAVNIVEGKPYAQSGYVQNPAAISVGTTSYPPGLPVLIAPFYAVFGFNLVPMKVLMVVVFFAALLVFGLTVERRLSWPFFALLLFDLGFTPYFWEFKDNVEADFPFLLPCFLVLYLVARRSGSDRSADPPVGESVAVGTLIYMAVAFRTIGVALLVALLLHDAVSRRRLLPSKAFWIPALMFGILMVGQSLVLASDGGTYGAAFAERMNTPGKIIGSLILNAKYYVLAVTGRTLMSNGYWTLWADAMLLLSIGPFLVGFWKRLRHEGGILEAFTIVYAGVLLVWPFRQPNYLIPLIPLMAFYLLFGLDDLVRNVSAGKRLALAGGVFVLLLATYFPRYTTLSFDRIPHDVMSDDSMEFYDYVRSNLGPDEGIITRLPREVALFTDRPTSPPRHPAEDDHHYTVSEADSILARSRKIGFRYVAAGPHGFEFHQEILALWNLLDEWPGRFEEEWRNGEWRLVKAAHVSSRGPA